MELVTQDSKQIQIIKDNYAKGATNEELQLFLYQCERTGLSPIARQIYLIGRHDRKENRTIRTVQISIDGARLIAERSGKYAGQLGPWWCGSDGVWVDVWLKKEAPAAAKIGILRSDFKEPLYAVANFEAYNAQGPMWQKMPALMIAKCAEMLGLRRAFAQEVSGLYSTEEMDHIDNEFIPYKTIVPTAEETFDFNKEEHKKILRDLLINDLKISNTQIATNLNGLKEYLTGAVLANKHDIDKHIKDFIWK